MRGVLFTLLLWNPLKGFILPVLQAEKLAAPDQSELRDLLEIKTFPFWPQTSPVPRGFSEVGHGSVLPAPHSQALCSHDWHEDVLRMTPGHGALARQSWSTSTPAELLSSLCSWVWGSDFMALREEPSSTG